MGVVLMEKVLDYNEAQAPQETGYWCGPASTQMVLSCRGVWESEESLAYQLGTHTGGTDSIHQFPPVLNRYLPDGKYDYRDGASTDQFFAALIDSVDAGFGIVANIVAPPSDYPIGVKGSPTLNYAGMGTVYHYVALVGYDDEYPAIYWADSGFSPFWSWISLEQTVRLVANKGYTFSRATPMPSAWDVVAANQQGIFV
jgi:hypothetical protein